MVYSFHLTLRSHDYNVHIKHLLPLNLCAVTLLSWTNVSHFEKIPPATRSNGKQKHPVSKQRKRLAVMPKRAVLTTIYFDV